MIEQEIVEVTIDDLGSRGEGIGRLANGYTVFVEGGLPGEVVKAFLYQKKKSYALGRLVEIVKPSAYRQTPPCPVYRECGGCSLQHLEYEQQLLYKSKRVQDTLIRIGGFTDVKVLPCIGMEKPYCYRNKGIFRTGIDQGLPVLGMYSEKSHQLVPVTQCLIQDLRISGCLRKVEEYMQNVESHGITQCMVRVGQNTGEIMVALEAILEKEENLKILGEDLAEILGMASVVLFYPGKARKKECLEKVLWGRDHIFDEIDGIRFRISARSFYQVNPDQTRKLYHKVLELAALEQDDVVVDVYCGIGSITLFLAKHARWVYGIEAVSQAVDDGIQNALENAVCNVEFFIGKAEEQLLDLCRKRELTPSCVVLDPPRQGCEAALIEALKQVAPRRIVYVSCDPATMARDLKILCEGGGYELKAVHPFDCFGWTGHVETCCLLSKINL